MRTYLRIGGPVTIRADGPWAVVRSPEDLGAYLARLRVAHGLTQEELADELGISRRYLYEIESGRPNLYARRLFEIINLLDARVTVTSGSASPRP